MAHKILVIEDELTIRTNITLMLRGEGYSVRGAENGRRGLEMAREETPDLILCDVMMPEIDGFGVLEALRSEPRFADLPFVFLTALDDRASMRRGMTQGANDFLTKPFARKELLETVSSQLKRREVVQHALEEQLVLKMDELQRQYRDKLAGTSAETTIGPDPRATTGNISTATMLFSDIRNFTTYSERLSAADTARLLNSYFEQACKPVLAAGGRVVKFLGDGILVLFEHSPEGPNHARRALSAALGIALQAHLFRAWVHEHHGTGALPEFSVGVGIHTGEVITCQVGATGTQERTIIGDAVNIASRLETLTKTLGWVVIASRATIEAAGPGVTLGNATEMTLRGRSEAIGLAEVVAVTGEGGQLTAVELPQAVRDALRVNAQNTAQAAKGALNETLRMIASKSNTAGIAPVNISGYRIISKIGEGGMSNVFLVKRESDDTDVVLKILNGAGDKDLLARFMQEAAILASIDHPNVVRIFDQGFSDEYAYIAMEYFTGGTLTNLIRNGLSQRQALSLLAQAAGALREIHRRGIIHRDIKPENMMVRADGTIALVDFGVAKKQGEKLSQTRHGVVFGTPYYLSPEQAIGQPAVEASDIYSLGVIFHEMLTRRRPYQSETVFGLLHEHAESPVPRLPAELSGFQSLLDRMMAKKLQDRFANADALLDAIDALWTQIAIASSHVSTH